MPKKKDDSFKQIGDQLDRKFNTLEEGQELLLKIHFDLEVKMDKRFNEMDVKLDKVLSAVSNLVITTDAIKQEVAVIGDRVRQHEDKLEAIS
jgi:septation ring formation regulator EzrA